MSVNEIIVLSVLVVVAVAAVIIFIWGFVSEINQLKEYTKKMCHAVEILTELQSTKSYKKSDKPMRPKLKESVQKRIEENICPVCDSTVYRYHNCCPNCGQKLNWPKD